MKNKILIILIIALSLLCLISCGGGDGDDKKEYKTVTFIFGEQNSKSDRILFYEDGTRSRELNSSTAIYGYNLVGFFTSEGTQYFDAEANKLNDILIDRDLTVYAKYEPKNYTFTFDAQAGMLDDGSNKKNISVTVETDLKTVFPLATNANPKFEFDGWFNEDGSVRYTNGTEPLNDSLSWGYDFGSGTEIVFYAKFKVKELTVTLDFNDGVTPTEEIKVEYGQPIGDLSAYYMDNGTQDIYGWSSLSYSEAPLPETVTESIRIYAVWKEYKNAIFVYGNGDERTVRVHQTPGQSSKLPLQENPGYNFGGWFTTSTLAGNPIEAVPYGAVADKYYGKWTVADYTLSFDAGNGEEIESVIYHYRDTTLLPSAEREGYTFGGWYYDNEANAFFKIPSTLYGDKQLFAYWVPNTYNITYDAQGGEINKQKDKITFGESYTLFVPTRFGYTFLGWHSSDGIAYTDKDGVSLESWKEASDKTLYAKWETNVYTITYEANGGSQVAKQSYKHGEAIKFPSSPTKDGVFFDGWFNEDLTREYTEMQIALSDMTLYANWVESIAISNADGLNAIRDNPSAKYHLTNDINLRGESWAPIPEFTGTLDGCGYTVLNFSMSASKQSGFIAVNNGIIKNLTLSNFSLGITLGNIECSIGCLVGENSGKIINCHTDGVNIKTSIDIPAIDTVNTTVNIGGIAGITRETSLIDSCSSNATMHGTVVQVFSSSVSRPTSYVATRFGGIVGAAEKSTIINCVYIGSIDASLSMTGKINECKNENDLYAGGILGSGEAIIENCYASVSINLSGVDTKTKYNNVKSSWTGFYIGGIVGYLESGGSVNNSVSDGEYIAQNKKGDRTEWTKAVRLGGIAGQTQENTEISNCYSNASVIQKEGTDRATGGLVGYNHGKIKNSYCTGNVTSTDGTAGGFVGVNESTGTIMNCFSLGNVAFTTGVGTKGIFAGNNRGSLNGGAFASEAQLSASGNAIAITIMTGLTSMPKNDILNFGYIFNTLYWENTSWTVSDDEYPRLYFEVALKLNEK